MLSATSQVLVRNQDYFAQGRWLIVNAPEADVFSSLGNADFYGFHQYYSVYQQCTDDKPSDKHLFAAAYPTDVEFDGAIIYMPKAKEQAKMLIANMAACTKNSGQIFLVGENKSGIKGANKLFDTISTQVNKIDSARHCALYCATIEKGSDSDHKESQFNLDKWVKWYSLEHANESISIASLPGVFSAHELDAGTKLLLENLPNNLNGKVLDFACGAGVIACAVAKQYPESILTLTDISALALYCANLTLDKNNVTGDILVSDGLSKIEGRFDFILTNPPFHSGIQTDYNVTETFIQEAKRHLKANGKLMLVANRFLPYPDLIKQSLGKVKTTAQTSKFNLYQN